MKTRSKRPLVFVGSSTEGLSVARAVQVALDHTCEVRLWSQGVFELSQGTLEALVSGAEQFDFAVLVLTPDDLVESRAVGASAARDNVLFELGLFMGILGRRRTFVLFDRTANLRIPSDLAGVTCATYAPHDSELSGGLRASLGAPCTLIEDAIRSEGPRVKLADIVTLEANIRRLQEQLRGRRPSANPVLVEGGPLPGSECPPGIGCVLIDSFLIDAFPVTNMEFEQFVAENQEWSPEAIYSQYGIPYYLCEFRHNKAPTDKWDHPVVWINWFSAAAYCNWRSTSDGRRPVYSFRTPSNVDADLSADGWRLPTECEWEMAARVGSDAIDPWNGAVTPMHANFGQFYRGTTSVGRFDPNALGIFDMLGNVKQWCHNWYSDTAPPPAGNLTGPESGRFKSFRGASYMEDDALLRFSRRGKLPPENTNPDFGFRCVRRPGSFGS
jgi:formylglycine-generating enzyme required for sulfatase activity